MEENQLIGSIIGNYRIAAEINSGAFGSVYRAEHLHLQGRTVAIKFLHTYLGSAKERELFTQEAQFLAQLEHPHILPLLDFGFHERQPYLITRYAVGGSLRDRLRRTAPLPVGEAIKILSQVGQGLQYAHEREIVHRDLKPENILFNERGEALLADFGIATMLSTASVKHLTTVGGTPPYMAPEQFQGIISKEGDQYALGCIAYELLTGVQLFKAPDFLSMGWKHATEEPIRPTHHNPQIPKTTEAAILQALAKQRAERHASISAFLTAIQVPLTQPTVLRRPLQTTVPASPPIPPPGRTKEEWLRVGNEHWATERYHEALEAYDHAIHLDPGYALAYHNKGYALNELKRYHEALEAYDHAIHLDPNSALAYCNKGYALNELKRYEDALVAFDHAIHLNPNNALAYCNKGYALRNLKRYDEAIEAFDHAIRLDPDDNVAYRNKGYALNELKRYEDALEAYDHAIRLDPNYAPAHNGRGCALDDLQRYDEALAAYDHTIHLDPTYALAYNNKGFTLENLRRYDEALTAFDHAIHLDPNSALAYHNKANTLDKLGRHDEAQQIRAQIQP